MIIDLTEEEKEFISKLEEGDFFSFRGEDYMLFKKQKERHQWISHVSLISTNTTNPLTNQ